MLHTNVLKVASVSLLIKKQVLNDSLLGYDGERFFKESNKFNTLCTFLFCQNLAPSLPIDCWDKVLLL